MVRWHEMESRQPRLADTGRQRLVEPGVVLLATIRKDGTPRISPVEPLLMDGDLWLSMMRNSTKARDLARDDRVLVHSIVTNRDGEQGEFKIRGRAIEVTDDATNARYAATVEQELGWQPVPGKFRLFSVGIESVTYLRYEDGDQHQAAWPPAEESVRRKETATSLLPPEPIQHLLDPEG